MMGPPLVPGARPHVWVNCAVSLDGRLALDGGTRVQLSGPEDLVRVQRLRASSDAILIGVGTVVHDNPSLRIHWDLLGEPPGRSPTRVIVDASGRTPPGARVLDGNLPTILATSERNRREYPRHVQRVVAGREAVDLPLLFSKLGEMGIERLMVEGGARILARIAQDRLFDRWTIYTAPVVVGSENAPGLVEGPAAGRPEDMTRFRLESVERLGDGFLSTYVR